MPRMWLLDAYTVSGSIDILYKLLKERTKDESISHKKMPTLESHVDFVRSKPYPIWNLIYIDSQAVGTIYLGKDSNIGVSILRKFRRKGYAKQALEIFIDQYKHARYANINPKNKKSIKLFKSLGFKHIQNTYKLD